MQHAGKFFILLIFGSLLLHAKIARNGESIAQTNQPGADTTIGLLLIGNEWPGGADRKRATAYFLVTGNDSSAFRCYITESKSAQVGIDLRAGSNAIPWKQRLAELAALFPDASKAYSFDSLKNVYTGRLTETAELSPLITADYRKYFGKSNKIPTGTWINKMLLKNKLTADLNQVFLPYKMTVAGYGFEKLFFTNTGRGKELDGVVWAKMQKL